ncbi:MAG: hypothetical protein ACOC1X_02395 [Promethearchaeota archaeon]
MIKFHFKCSKCGNKFTAKVARFAPVEIFNCPECEKKMEMSELIKVESDK